MSASLTVMAAIGLALAQVEGVGQRPPDVIGAAISDLAANQYGVRQSAMERLWAAGEAAIPALEGALNSPSAEVRARAQFVLDNLRMGVAYDTPKSILREIQRFRSDSVEQRRQAIQQLETALRPRIILALLQTETVARVRTDGYRALERCVVRTIAAGKLDDVAATLRGAAHQDDWLRHYAAFTAQRGATDEELAVDSPDVPAADPARPALPAELARRRAMLLRAAGDSRGASREAEHASEDLLLSLLIEDSAWMPAANVLARRIENDPQGAGADVEQLGLAAAGYRLAGSPALADPLLNQLMSRGKDLHQQLRRLGSDEPLARRDLVARQWHFAKALLLNGRYDDALGLVRDDQRSFVFELLCEQYRYREAFDLVPVPYPAGFDLDWFNQLARESATAADSIEGDFQLAQAAIRHTHLLGRRDDARQFFAALWDSLRGTRSTRRLRLLCDTAIKLSLREQAREVAALVAQLEDRPAVLSVLYPTRTATATMWWEYYRAAEPTAPLQ
jgi:hypothetical protein